MSGAFTDADYERVVRERDEAFARIDSQRSQIAFYRTACTARFLPEGFGDETMRGLINDLMEDRDDARSTIEDLNDEIARGREAIRIYRTETEAAKRERDLALGRLENEIKAAKQARMAEERARESLDELDAAIYDCLPSDYDDDSPLDCVEHAADRLRELAEERDEARAEVDRWRVKAEAYGGMVHGCGPVLESAGHPIDPFQPDGRVGGIARSVADLVKERDEARREADRFRHGCTVEGDFVCPNEYAVSELTAERNFLRALKKNHEEDFARVCKERDEARAEVDKLSESAKAAWEAECVMREQRDRYHAEWKQERHEVERLRTALLEVQTSESAPAWFADGFHDGWKAGAAAMREACAAALMADGLVLSRERAAKVVRALPIPEET